MLCETLSAIRTILYTTTNETPHDRLFQSQRREGFGYYIPAWIRAGTNALLCNFVRNKSEPLVTKVKIIGVVSHKAVCIEYADGRRSTVSTSDLAPTSGSMNFDHDESENHIAEKPPIQENSMISVSLNTQLVHDEVFEPSSDSPITRPSHSAEEATQGSHLFNSQIADSPVKPTMVRSPDANPSGRPSRQRKAPGHLKDYVVDF